MELHALLLVIDTGDNSSSSSLLPVLLRELVSFQSNILVIGAIPPHLYHASKTACLEVFVYLYVLLFILNTVCISTDSLSRAPSEADFMSGLCGIPLHCSSCAFQMICDPSPSSEHLSLHFSIQIQKFYCSNYPNLASNWLERDGLRFLLPETSVRNSPHQLGKSMTKTALLF